VVFAQKYFAKKDPIGKGMSLAGPHNWLTIAGMGANTQHEDLSKPASPEIFEPFDRFPSPRVTLILRAAVPPETLTGFVRAAIDATNRCTTFTPHLSTAWARKIR
jgi:hypothetical protein